MQSHESLVFVCTWTFASLKLLHFKGSHFGLLMLFYYYQCASMSQLNVPCMFSHMYYLSDIISHVFISHCCIDIPVPAGMSIVLWSHRPNNSVERGFISESWESMLILLVRQSWLSGKSIQCFYFGRTSRHKNILLGTKSHSWVVQSWT